MFMPRQEFSTDRRRQSHWIPTLLKAYPRMTRERHALQSGRFYFHWRRDEIGPAGDGRTSRRRGAHLRRDSDQDGPTGVFSWNFGFDRRRNGHARIGGNTPGRGGSGRPNSGREASREPRFARCAPRDAHGVQNGHRGAHSRFTATHGDPALLGGPAPRSLHGFAAEL